MKFGGIRTRMLLAALLPIVLVAASLAAVFSYGRVSDIGQAHGQRSRSLVRQIATVSEYGLFSGNVEHLQNLVLGAVRESDVLSATILDANGRVLASAGAVSFMAPPALTGLESETLDSVKMVTLLEQPVVPTQLRGNDLYDSWKAHNGARPPLLGYVLMEVSSQSIARRERELLWLGLSVSLVGLLFGGLLAVGLGRGVIEPVVRVSSLVERIGNGDLSARLTVPSQGPLTPLQLGLNQMAERLESGRNEMESRIAAATLELRVKKEQAEAATRAKSRFLSVASHDLRQPTHALGMFVARLAQLPHDKQTGQLIGNLEASVRAMQDMLDALLDLSRLDADAVQVHKQPFALTDIFEQLLAELALSATEKDLRLKVRATQLWLMSDPLLVHRILLNLVGNALRYTQKGGVLVAARRCADGRHARVEIWDSGIGIAPEFHDAIFREFFQIDNRERDRRKGFGLGLNIVQRNAQLLGHRLQFDSRVGVGTRFCMEIPLAAASDIADGVYPLAEQAPDNLAGLEVLVIEDDGLALEGIAILLESWGCIVRRAIDLSQAQSLLVQGTGPDVIVSDYRLPGNQNGIEAIRQLRRTAGRSVASCLMSGDTDPALMQAVKDAGLTLLHKPVRPAKLRSLLRHLAMADQTRGANRA